ASAALQVVFQATPLFSNTNIAPGHSVTRTVTVTNTAAATTTEAVFVTVASTSNTGLADAMTLTIASSTAPDYFDDTFSAFFADSPIALGSLAPGESRVYEFTAAFPSAAGNEYQTKTMGFDLVIGF